MNSRSRWIFVLTLITFIFCGCKPGTSSHAALLPAGNVDPNYPAYQNADNGKEKLLDMALKISGRKLSHKERNVVMRVLNLNETDMIKGLSVCAEFSDGRYPPSLDHETVIKQIEGWGLAKYGKYDDLPDDRKRKIEKKMYDAFLMASYYKRLVNEHRDAAYYGDKVVPDDGNAVLVRWKESVGKYRVVFGDLSIETITPERLAELEKGLCGPGRLMK